MKRKSDTTDAMKVILDVQTPILIQSDNGTEFLNNSFQSLLQAKGVRHVTVNVGDHNRQGLIERFTQTIENNIARYQESRKSNRYIDFLEDLVFNYNHTYHRGVNDNPESRYQKNPSSGSIKVKTTRHSIRVGDLVRILKDKQTFSKGYEPKYTSAVYTVINGNGYSFSLSDDKGKVVPFIQDTMTTDKMVSNLQTLMTQTGCRALDWDVEGAAIASPNVSKIYDCIVQVQSKFPGLQTSFTLPVQNPQWGALSNDGITFVRNAIQNGVRIHIVNAMVMDIYAGQVNWSDVSIKIMESLKSQLQQIFPSYCEQQVYKLMGVCPMIGLQDDNSTFSVNDMKKLAQYAVSKGLGRFSFWSLQRDQVGYESLATHSKVNTTDFEFYNAVVNIARNCGLICRCTLSDMCTTTTLVVPNTYNVVIVDKADVIM